MISIAIPCYEMQGSGAKVLEYSFSKIEKQNYQDFEVVVSDHSVDYAIGDLCKDWSSKFLLNYQRYEEKRGSPAANTNNSIRMCKGDLIKILNQDDYLYDENSLKKTVANFEDRSGWLLSSYVHTKDKKEFYKVYHPFLHERIHLKNLIGTPSCLAIRNKDVIFYNEDLFWAYDCEYYKRLYIKFGMPSILRDVTVVNFLWEGQMSNTIVNSETHLKEKLYIAKLYGNELFQDEVD